MLKQNETPQRATEGLATKIVPDRYIINNPTFEQPFNDKFSAPHLQELRSSAICDQILIQSGAYTAYEASQLPSWSRYLSKKHSRESVFGNSGALVYPMTNVDGSKTGQVKPAQPLMNSRGEESKYFGPANNAPDGFTPPKLVSVVPVTDSTERALVVEGVKQALAVASYIDAKTAVYRICGITGWSCGNWKPSPQLKILAGLDVFILPDADASQNPNVYTGALYLGKALKELGSTSARFIQLPELPHMPKAGVDDVLADIRGVQPRRDALQQWFDKAALRPAKHRPRTPVHETKDAAVVLDAYEKALLQENGLSLFRRGDKLVELVTPRGSEPCVLEVSPGQMQNLMARYVFYFKRQMIKNPATGEKEPVDVPATLKTAYAAPLIARYTNFSELSGFRSAPYVSDDGSFVTADGYDEDSKLLLKTSSDLRGLEIPDAPTDEQVERAKALLDFILQDFPFRTPDDKLRCIASFITPLIRPIVPTSPAFLYAAPAPGTGKGFLANVPAQIALGRDADVTPLPQKDEEVEKTITSRLLEGDTFLFFDEVTSKDGSNLSSKPLNALITSSTWRGRILGKSQTVSLDNKATVYLAGNNPVSDTDLARRMVRVDLIYRGKGRPEDREGFAIPDFQQYIRDHRRELFVALATLVRAWFAAGSPKATDKSFGSFEKWHTIMAGIFKTAGYGEFTAVSPHQKSANDYIYSAWLTHFTFLKDVLDEEGRDYTFLARDVAVIAKTTKGFELPPDVDPAADTDKLARELGRAYTKIKDRSFDGFCITEAGKDRRNRKQWTLLTPDDGDDNDSDPDDPHTPDDGGDDTPPAPPALSEQPTSVASEKIVYFDLETGDADQAHTADSKDYVRLAAWAVNDGAVQVDKDASALVEALSTADKVVGHNILRFDLPVLNRLYGLDVDALVASDKVRDTLVLDRLANPPVSGGAAGQRAKKYTLDAVARRYKVNGKLIAEGETVLKRLAKEYGGYDQIPRSHEDYIRYAAQDVEATRSIFTQMPDADAYASREHRLMWLLQTPARAGIRVDTDLMDSYLASEERGREEIRQWLESTAGVPNNGASSWSTAAGKKALEAYFTSIGVEAPKTAKGSLSTSKDSLAELATARPDNDKLQEIVSKLIEMQQLSTPAATLKKSLRADGKVHPNVDASQATGRISTTNPGMTVFGSREERLMKQRAMILPDSDDEVFISVDLSQIDARAMAVGSQDATYAALFQPGRDSHTEMAIRVFGDPKRRKDAKALAHATNYGMGAQTFSSNACIPIEDAEQQLAALRSEFPLLEEFKQQLRAEGEAYGYVKTAWGRKVPLQVGKEWTQAPAAYGQGSARDAFAEGLLNLPVDLQQRIRIFIHDEVVLSVPKETAEEDKQRVVEAFTSVQWPVKSTVPVLADSEGPGDNWATCYTNK